MPRSPEADPIIGETSITILAALRDWGSLTVSQLLDELEKTNKEKRVKKKVSSSKKTVSDSCEMLRFHSYASRRKGSTPGNPWIYSITDEGEAALRKEGR